MGDGGESNPRGSHRKGLFPGDEGPATRSKSEDCRSILGAVLDRSSLNPALPSRGPLAVSDGPDTASVVGGASAPGLDHVLEIGRKCAGICAARIWDRCISRQSPCGFDSRLGHSLPAPPSRVRISLAPAGSPRVSATLRAAVSCRDRQAATAGWRLPTFGSHDRADAISSATTPGRCCCARGRLRGGRADLGAVAVVPAVCAGADRGMCPGGQGAAIGADVPVQSGRRTARRADGDVRRAATPGLTGGSWSGGTDRAGRGLTAAPSSPRKTARRPRSRSIPPRRWHRPRKRTSFQRGSPSTVAPVGTASGRTRACRSGPESRFRPSCSWWPPPG